MDLLDPLEFARILWPNNRFYNKQIETLYSVKYNDETFVPAGNMLGKDYVAGYVAVWVFLSSVKTGHTCRIITTSVKDDHLRVLWGEIGRFIAEARQPLTRDKGGPLICNHRDIRKVMRGIDQYGRPYEQICSISYLRGMVSERGEGMAGHHAEHTLCIIDEASGVDDIVYTQSDTWAKRKLIIGNPNPCANFFYHGVKGGDLLAEDQ